MNGSQGPSPYQFGILRALNGQGKHVYAGTVSKSTKDARRAKNRVARKSRAQNRSK